MSMDQNIARIRDVTSQMFYQHLPDKYDAKWVDNLVDTPRFGWDWESLEAGFFAPLRVWADQHDFRLRPVFSVLTMESLGVNPAQHDASLAALELEYQCSIMLDDLRNGKDLTSSTADAVKIPLPVWVTIAYNGRQLAPVLIMRRATGLDETKRVALSLRFSRFLFQQGIGSVVDLAGSETGMPVDSMEHTIARLATGSGPLTLSLACEVACAAANLDESTTTEIARAGRDVGVGLRLGALAQGHRRSFQVNGERAVEPRQNWVQEADSDVLLAARDRLFEQAYFRVKAVSSDVAEAFEQFLSLFEPVASGEKA